MNIYCCVICKDHKRQDSTVINYVTDVDQGPDTLNYLRIPYLMEIEFSKSGAPK